MHTHWPSRDPKKRSGLWNYARLVGTMSLYDWSKVLRLFFGQDPMRSCVERVYRLKLIPLEKLDSHGHRNRQLASFYPRWSHSRRSILCSERHANRINSRRRLVIARGSALARGTPHYGACTSPSSSLLCNRNNTLSETIYKLVYFYWGGGRVTMWTTEKSKR